MIQWKNGYTVLVYGRGTSTQDKADTICRELAQVAWDERHRYVDRLAQIKTLQDATAMAKERGEDTTMPPLLFADIADNPGGGARSNTTFVLKSFIDAGVKGAVFGHAYDIAAVKKCHAAGAGASIDLTLNEEEDHPKSDKLTIKGSVLSVSPDGVFFPKLGTSKVCEREVTESMCAQSGVCVTEYI